MNYWQIILLIASTILSLFSLLVNESKGKLKKYFIVLSVFLMIISLGISVSISIDELEEKGKAKEELITNFQRTINKGDTSIQKISIAIDSLDKLQTNSRIIIDSVSKQIELQNFLIQNSKELLQRNDSILSKQSDIYNTSDRVLNPLFPLWINMKLEVPFENQPLKSYCDYLYEIKKCIEDSGFACNISDDSASYGYRLYKGTSLDTLNLTVFKIKSIFFNNPILNPYHFKISIINTNKNHFTGRRQLGFEKIMTLFLPVVRYDVLVDFKHQKLQFNFSYFIKDPSFDPFLTNTLIGANDLRKCLLVFSLSDKISNYKIINLTLLSKNFPANYINIDGIDKDHKRMAFDNLHDADKQDILQLIYIHRITKNDFSIKYH